MAKDSEFRLYPLIFDKLKELGWDIRSVKSGGRVHTQNEIYNNPQLKVALGKLRPENTVELGNSEYWIIEAKSSINKLPKAISEAKEYAQKINSHQELSCKFITGIAGSPDTTYFVETQCLVNGEWTSLTINRRKCTGFLSPPQIQKLLVSGKNELSEYEIDDDLFKKKTADINSTLHEGAINKRNRASALACILLALAEDETLQISDNATTLIKDINARAEQKLKSHEKNGFFDQIKITLPPSPENHHKHRKALTSVIEVLRDLNIASAINSGRDVLGQFYEQFLTYANDAKELGIVFTPRHITKLATDMLNVQRSDVVLDPACGTGGFLVSALDKVRQDSDDVESFKLGNLHGIELDPMIATLALVNMIFRGDGSSNIVEGDSLNSNIEVKSNKVLMNPPFALQDFEWKFVDKALNSLVKGGLLFAVLPTTALGSTDNKREELTWRKEMLKRHRLVAVITLPRDLFYPNVSKGTYGVVIRAHRPHEFNKNFVIWAVLSDGIIRTKTQKSREEGGGKLQFKRNKKCSW